MFITRVTVAGQAKIAAAVLAGTQILFTEVAVGDVADAPTGEETELRNEVDRVPVNLIEADPVLDNRINIEAVIPTTSGGYWIREFGIFDEDGDLIIIGQYPATYKPLESEGSTRAQVIRTALVISRIETITLTTDLTTVLTTRDYVDAHQNRRDNPHEVTVAQLIPGGTVNQALFKYSNDDGDVEWRDITAVAVIVDAQTEVQTLAADQTTVDLSAVTTTGLAVYVGGARLIPGADYNETSTTQIELDRSYPEGTPIMLVNNDPYGEVEATTTTIGLMRKSTPDAVYKMANPTIGWGAISPEELPYILPAIAPNRIWKLGVDGQRKCAFAAVLGSGGSVVTSQRIVFGVGTNVISARPVSLNSGVPVNLAAVVAPGSYTIWWDIALNQLQAHDISWAAIEAGTRPTADTYGPLGGFEVGANPGVVGLDILPYSCWDTMFRPTCRDPRGMVLVANRFWADVYLTNTDAWNNALSNSTYNKTIADGINLPSRINEIDPVSFYGSCNWWVGVHLMGEYQKRLANYEEFCMLADGAASGFASRPTVTGFTSGRRSRWGVEQATGCVPVWGGGSLVLNSTTPTTAYSAGWDGGGGSVRSSSSVADILPIFGSDASSAGGSAFATYVSAAQTYVGIRGACDHMIVT